MAMKSELFILLWCTEVCYHSRIFVSMEDRMIMDSSCVVGRFESIDQ